MHDFALGRLCVVENQIVTAKRKFASFQKYAGHGLDEDDFLGLRVERLHYCALLSGLLAIDDVCFCADDLLARVLTV
jgi:hypothetical protein